MNKSESIKELATAMAKAQGEFEGAAKDSLNPHFKSKYADLESVVAAIKPHLAKHGLSFSQLSSEVSGSAAIETIIMHSSGEWLSTGIVCVPVSKNDAHGMGSAFTYARRYSLSAAFGIAPEDDDGNAAVKAKPESAKPTGQTDYEKLPEGRKRHVDGVADLVTKGWEFAGVEGAFDTWMKYKLSEPLVEEETAAWWLLDSKVRTAIKAHGLKLKEAKQSN